MSCERCGHTASQHVEDGQPLVDGSMCFIPECLCVAYKERDPNVNETKVIDPAHHAELKRLLKVQAGFMLRAQQALRIAQGALAALGQEGLADLVSDTALDLELSLKAALQRTDDEVRT